MEKITLEAQMRGVGRHPVRELRNADLVPAVVYGGGVQPQAVAINARTLRKALLAAGSGLLTLQVTEQTPMSVLAREIQRDPIRHHILHVDFQAVSLTEKLRLQVALIQEGSAPAMKLNGDLVLVRHIDHVEIECLPNDIPNHLVADLSTLLDEDSEILVRDLQLPNGVKVLTTPDHVVFSLTLSRAGSSEEDAEVAGTPTSEVAVVTKGKAAKEGAEEAPEKK